MSIFSSLYTGVSGMRANERGFSVIGDNIANMNTVGFKGSRAIFSDVLNQTILGSAGVTSDLGQGSVVGGIQNIMTQGALLQTGVTTDLAIGGNGFFVLEGRAGGLEGDFYTRNGQFRIDNQGFLANHSGLLLQGYPADPTGNLGATVGNLQVGMATSPPNPTTSIELNLNLEPNTPVDTNVFNPSDPLGLDVTAVPPNAAAAFSTSVPLYDSLGNDHDVEVYFVKSSDAPATWDWYATIDSGELDTDQANGGAGAQAPGTATVIAQGQMTFNSQGQLDTETGNIFNVAFAGAVTQGVNIDFGNSLTTDLGDGSGTSYYAGGNAVNSMDQDGFGAGTLAFIAIDEAGRIEGTFSNGDSRVLGGITLATFQGEDQLRTVGGNLLTAGPEVSEPILGIPNSGGRGLIFAGSLEQSNVDLTNEFTQMITSQRGFQASSRTVTTGNEMLTELVNLIR